QSLWSWSDVISWIAGNKRKLRIWRLLQDRDILRHHNLFACYFVTKNFAIPAHHNVIALVQLVDVAEECVAMTGNDSISGFSGSGGLFHMAWPLGKLFA